MANVFSNYKKVLMDKILGRVIETSIENNFETFQDSFQYTQSTASSLWSIVHNYGSTDVMIDVFVYDDNDNLVKAYPTTSFTDTNTIVLDFGNSPVTGIANLLFWGDTYVLVTPSAALTYDQTVEAKNPDHYWPLNTDLTDVISGDNLTLTTTNSGGVDLVPDAYGHILSFDSTIGNDYALLDSPAVLTNNFTLEAWVNPTTLTAFHTIFGTPVYGFQFDQTGALYMYSSLDAVQAVGATIISDGKYSHTVVTVDSSNVVKFYINGVYYAADGALTDTYSFDRIGSDGSNEKLNGTIGNPAIYNRVLSQAEVLSNFNAGQNHYRYTDNVAPLPSPTPTMTPNAVSLTPTPTPSVTPVPSFYYTEALNASGLTSKFYTRFQVNNTLIHSSGKIYLVGSIGSVNGTNVANNITRLNSDFSFDSTFTAIDVNGSVNGITELSDGSMIAFGNFTQVNSQTYSGLFKLTSTGVVDTSFVDLNPANTIYSVIQTADSKIYVGGYFTSFGGSSSYQKFARLNSNGTLDTTFTPLTFSSSFNYVTGVYQTADGKIYFYGSFSSINSNTYSNYARLNSDGTLDTGFVDIGINSAPNFFNQTADGKIYIGGLLGISTPSGPLNYIVRLNSDGSLDSSWSNVLDSGTPRCFGQAENGTIYIGSTVVFGVVNSQNYGKLLVLNSDGSLGTPDPYVTGLANSGIVLITPYNSTDTLLQILIP